jgi:integrase/recombinase XerD
MKILTKLNEFENWYCKKRGYNTTAAKTCIKRVWKFVWDIGNLSIDRIKPKHFNLWFKKLEKQEVKPATTRNYYFAVISVLRFYKEAYKQKVPKKFKVKLPNLPQTNYVEILTYQEIEQILSAIKIDTFEGLRLRLFVEAMLTTACRPSEVLQFPRYPKSMMTIVGKGNRKRLVPCSSRLRYWIERFESVRTDNDEFLFVNKDGSRLNYNKIQKEFLKLKRWVGLREKICLHTLRHTALTQILRQTGNVKLTSHFAGHSNWRTTLKYYLGITPDDLLDISEKLNLPEIGDVDNEHLTEKINNSIINLNAGTNETKK